VVRVREQAGTMRVHQRRHQAARTVMAIAFDGSFGKVRRPGKPGAVTGGTRAPGCPGRAKSCRGGWPTPTTAAERRRATQYVAGRALGRAAAWRGTVAKVLRPRAHEVVHPSRRQYGKRGGPEPARARLPPSDHAQQQRSTARPGGYQPVADCAQVRHHPGK